MEIMRPLPIIREYIWILKYKTLAVHILFIQDAVSLRFGNNGTVGKFSFEYENE